MPRILIDRIPGATRLALTVNERLEDIILDIDTLPSLLDGIYLARVTDVVPSIKAAFLDLGGTEALLNYRQDAPVEGSLVTVQVAGDHHGDKDVRVVEQIALEGRFSVLRPAGSGITISQGIREQKSRSRLQAALPRGIDGNITVRSRTATLMESDQLDVMTSEIIRLAGRWGEALELAERMQEPGCLIPAPTAIERAMRDWASSDCEIITAEAALLKPVKDALAHLAPELALHARLDAEPGLLARMGVEDDLAVLAEKEVALKGGGRISIYETPALTAIDVDSGNACSWAPGQTADGVNAAAAEAIARQLRLRHIGGTIVVDFVGFEAQAGKALEELRQALAGDMLASKPVGASGHGLAILTRRRLGPSMSEQLAALERLQ